MATKTKDRILTASRLLFNEEGVSNVAMVDIAATIDISPGNLYYHYRGKDELIPVLFELFSTDFMALVSADISALKSLEDRWTFCYLLLDTLYNYRCLYELDAIRFDRSLTRRYKRLQQSLSKCIESLINQEQLSSMSSGDIGEFSISGATQNDHAILSDNIAIFMYAWVKRADADIDKKAEQTFLNEGVYRVFYQISSIAPSPNEFLASCKDIQRQSLANS